MAFKHGETEKNIKVKLLPAEPQPNETFCISIKNPTGCHLGMINMAVVTIDEDAEVQAVERILKQHLERRAEAFEPDFYVAGSGDIWAQQFADAILCGGTIDDNGKYIEVAHMGKPRKKAEPFIWAIPIVDAPALVKATGIELDEAGRLTPHARSKTRALRPMQIRRFR